MTRTVSNSINQLDAAIRSSLTSLVANLSQNRWTGRRERELVSLFCFGYLLQEFQPGTFLHDATQIGIEIAVPQVSGQIGRTGRPSSKEQVCKDIVIWPKARMTCWDSEGNPTIKPTSIIEWKHNQGVISGYDVDWLREFSIAAHEFVGYAVSTNHGRPNTLLLSCSRIYDGEGQSDWLLIK